MKKLTQREFIERSIAMHGNKYNYSKTIYLNRDTKVTIICPVHGEFQQGPRNHLKGHGCPKCGAQSSTNAKKPSLEEFIDRANKAHHNKYDYSKVNYINCMTKVTIICPVHGEFQQTPDDHLRGHGCAHCGANQRIEDQRKSPCKEGKRGYPMNTTTFIERAKKVHQDKYDYSKVQYKDIQTKVTIICPIHGEFQQNPGGHLQGSGCPKCGIIITATSHMNSLEDCINECEQKYGYGFDYSKTIYKGLNKRSCIICPLHGEFYQSFNNLRQGISCPKCKQSNGERLIEVYLKNHGYIYYYDHRFPDCKDKKTLPFDFYLPDYNMCIEFDGIQHFKPVMIFKGEKMLEYTQRHDRIKNEYCKSKGISLLRISYKQMDKIDEIIENYIKEL